MAGVGTCSEMLARHQVFVPKVVVFLGAVGNHVVLVDTVARCTTVRALLSHVILSFRRKSETG